MNPFLWFQRLFVPAPESDDSDDIPELRDETPFVFTQHLRIVTAIVITIISAMVIWWILT